MARNLDAIQLNIKCDACGDKLRKTIGWLKHHCDLTCEVCGIAIPFNREEFLKEVEIAENSVTQTVRSMKINLRMRLPDDIE